MASVPNDTVAMLKGELEVIITQVSTGLKVVTVSRSYYRLCG